LGEAAILPGRYRNPIYWYGAVSLKPADKVSKATTRSTRTMAQASYQSRITADHIEQWQYQLFTVVAIGQ
jgi:hypothetical protein